MMFGLFTNFIWAFKLIFWVIGFWLQIFFRMLEVWNTIIIFNNLKVYSRASHAIIEDIIVLPEIS